MLNLSHNKKIQFKKTKEMTVFLCVARVDMLGNTHWFIQGSRQLTHTLRADLEIGTGSAVRSYALGSVSAALVDRNKLKMTGKPNGT